MPECESRGRPSQEHFRDEAYEAQRRISRDYILLRPYARYLYGAESWGFNAEKFGLLQPFHKKCIQVHSVLCPESRCRATTLGVPALQKNVEDDLSSMALSDKIRRTRFS